MRRVIFVAIAFVLCVGLLACCGRAEPDAQTQAFTMPETQGTTEQASTEPSTAQPETSTRPPEENTTQKKTVPAQAPTKSSTTESATAEKTTKKAGEFRDDLAQQVLDLLDQARIDAGYAPFLRDNQEKRNERTRGAKERAKELAEGSPQRPHIILSIMDLPADAKQITDAILKSQSSNIIRREKIIPGLAVYQMENGKCIVTTSMIPEVEVDMFPWR